MVHTGISLNDRFTQMQTQSQQQSRPQRSRSQSRSRRIVNPNGSVANSRLLQEFKRKHTVRTALKLKRRSLRNTAGGGISGGATRGPRVGGVKSVRLGPGGKPVRSNNVTHLATMRADLVANARRRSGSSQRPSRSSSQVGGLRQRLGQRRSNVGGAAERVERRRQQQHQQQQQQQQRQLGRRNRSRSRSRQPQPVRSRSQSRGRERSQSRSRSQNGNRFVGGRNAVGQRRGGVAAGAATRSSSSARRVSVKQRLGLRPGQAGGSASAGKGNRRLPRRGSSKLRGVTGGRVERRRNNSNQGPRGVSAALSGRGRARGRSAAAGGGGNSAAASTSRRSRSRTRAVVAANLAAQTNRPIGRRGASGANGKVAKKAANKNGNKNNNNNIKNNRNAAAGGKQKPRQQQPGAGRRGRSRNRANRNDTGNQQREVKREDLDKELDQYMSTTKSEMDYLLK